MKILVVSCVSDLSEAALYCSLARSGHQVHLVCDPRETNTGQFEALGGVIFRRRIRSRLDSLSALFLRNLLKRHQYDVVYSPFNKGLSTALLASLGCRVKIATYRGTLGNLSRFDPASYLTHLNPRLSRVICNCEAVYHSLREAGVSEDKLSVIYKGHDPSWYVSRDTKSRGELGLTEDDFVVGMIANIRPLKGVEYLIRATASLQHELPVQLVIIGDSPDSRPMQLSEQLGASHRVHFLGFRPDAREYLPLFDVFVMPSTRREGFPRAVVEAYCNRIPAIVTQVGGMAELVQDSKTGFVVSPSDEQALADAMRKVYLLPDKGKAMGSAGFERVNELFHVEQYQKKARELFESLV